MQRKRKPQGESLSSVVIDSIVTFQSVCRHPEYTHRVLCLHARAGHRLRPGSVLRAHERTLTHLILVVTLEGEPWGSSFHNEGSTAQKGVAGSRGAQRELSYTLRPSRQQDRVVPALGEPGRGSKKQTNEAGCHKCREGDKLP